MTLEGNIRLPGSERIVDFTMGQMFTLFLTNQGRVYFCGYTDLARGGLDPAFYPLSVSTLTLLPPSLFSGSLIAAVAAGLSHSVFLDVHGRVCKFLSDSSFS